MLSLWLQWHQQGRESDYKLQFAMKDELASKHHALFCWFDFLPQYFIDLLEIFFSIILLQIPLT